MIRCKGPLSFGILCIVCKSLLEKTCNVNGVYFDCNNSSGNGCGSNSRCKVGYEGSQCEFCSQGFYPTNSSKNGFVDAKNGQGPKCQCKTKLLCSLI